jgi:5'-3' exonuclease
MTFPLKVHLVDGTFELFRCFFGAPPAEVGGQQVGATRGLIGTLLSLLKEPDCTHVGVAFDTVIESFRNDLFAGYKTGAGLDVALASQMPLVEEATRALGLVTWSMIEFEADDALCTAAHRFGAPRLVTTTAAHVRPQGSPTDPAAITQVRICSPDKDLAQCVVGDRVVLVDRLRKKSLDEDGVRQKFGVPPQAIPDFLALVGDAADGVPGLSGFGEKSAAALLRHYGTLEAIPTDLDALDVGLRRSLRGADRLIATLAARREDALLYKTLTTLRRDAPVHEPLEALRWRGPDHGRLEALATTLGDARLVERVERAWQEHTAQKPDDDATRVAEGG